MNVSFDITRSAGHLGHVKFRLGRQIVQPFFTAPWVDKPESAKLIPLLRELRGDFFCAPFGAGPAWRNETHPPHGESANATWKVQSSEAGRFVATLQTRVRPGTITKLIEAREGETNIYQSHLLEGFQGGMCLGHHAMLDFTRNGPGNISTSKLRLAQVLTSPFEDPVQGGYTALKHGAWFRYLDSVPMTDGGKTDLTRYPAREGFDDLVMLHHKDADDFAWSAVVFPDKKFVWFALKNPAHLASTVLWHSNGGRHYAPWSGRIRGMLGIEDVTAYFHLGLAASLADNPWKQKGVATSLALTRRHGTRIPYIMGVAPLSAGFDAVGSIQRTATGIRLQAVSGALIDHDVDTPFLK
ncbi:MAG: hypothetical protein DVB26_07090 [Verrucomicrobia bacterium]|nr:MAG: hypothetical protein DVB26_07090 [Verrucomicrobiota bacterium]